MRVRFIASNTPASHRNPQESGPMRFTVSPPFPSWALRQRRVPVGGRALNFCLSRYTVVQQPPFREGKQEWRKRDFRRGSIPIRPQTPMPTIYVHFADGMREEERGDRVSRGPRGLSRCDLFFMRNREAHCKCQEDGAQLPERTRASGEREPNMPIQTKWPRDGQKEGRKEGQTDGDLFLGE